MTDSDYQNPTTLIASAKINGSLTVQANKSSLASLFLLYAGSSGKKVLDTNSSGELTIYDTVNGNIGMTINSSGNVLIGNTVAFYSIFSLYAGINTQGLGVPAIYAAPANVTVTASVTNIATFTPTVKGLHRIHAVLDVTASSSGTAQVTLDWYDSAGTHHTTIAQTLYKEAPAGTVAGSQTASVTAGDVWEMDSVIVTDGTHAIIVGFVKGGTSLSINIAASIEELTTI
jgi:hypothetical protein